MQISLYQIFFLLDQIVSEVVKTELIIGTICDITCIRFLTLTCFQAVQDNTDTKTEAAVHCSHPIRVTLCQVIIDGDNMHAFSFQRIQVCGKHGNQRLTFTSLHLGNTSLVKNNASHNLLYKRPHLQLTECCFAGYGKCFREKVIQ